MCRSALACGHTYKERSLSWALGWAGQSADEVSECVMAYLRLDPRHLHSTIPFGLPSALALAWSSSR
jgi:hypothetical protein